MIEPTHTRYTALIELVAEQVDRGDIPRMDWLQEIAIAQTLHPEWALPPVPAPIVSLSSPKAAVPLAPGERILIEIETDAKAMIDKILNVWGQRYCVFQSGGQLLELQIDSGKDIKFLVRDIMNPRMVPIGTSRAWFIAARECRFGATKSDKAGGSAIVEQLPPEWIGRTITSLPYFPYIPTLTALAPAPTLRADGELIHEPGYDKSTGILLSSDLKITIPEAPTQESAKAALDRLLDLVRDFDFVSTADATPGKSAWLAGLLAVACRHTFDGPAPFFIVDASRRGSGKTTLVDLACVIATGNRAPKMFYTDDDKEMDKRISALAIAGDSMVLIDNIVGRLASPPLDAAVTSTSYQGRVLGKTEMTSLSMKIVWWATGNGIVIGADTARRALRIRLEPQCERPEDRVGPKPGISWAYPDLLNYAKEHRASLLGDALTIVSAYIKAGKPGQKLTPMGSFDAWTSTIRSAIVWAGGDDPCATTKDARAVDLEDIALRRMVECWPVADNVEVTAATLLAWAVTVPPLAADPEQRAAFEQTRTNREMWRNALLEWLPARKNDLPTARELGYALRSIDGTIIETFKISGGIHTKSGVPWKRMTTGEISTKTPEIAQKPILSSIK